MLHDIGIFMTHAPELGCRGVHAYISHGHLGHQLLEGLGFPRHALICERHVGVGITMDEIEAQNLSLPRRDMVPETLEEQIICYADKFFSKIPYPDVQEKSTTQIVRELKALGGGKVETFLSWVRRFE